MPSAPVEVERLEGRGGDGTSFPKPGDRCTVHYVGSLAESGDVFDSSRAKGSPFTFVLGEGAVIKGWELGLPQISLGETARLRVSAAGGYGSRGHTSAEAVGTGTIPPNAELVFEVLAARHGLSNPLPPHPPYHASMTRTRVDIRLDERRKPNFVTTYPRSKPSKPAPHPAHTLSLTYPRDALTARSLPPARLRSSCWTSTADLESPSCTNTAARSTLGVTRSSASSMPSRRRPPRRRRSTALARATSPSCRPRSRPSTRSRPPATAPPRREAGAAHLPPPTRPTPPRPRPLR